MASGLSIFKSHIVLNYLNLITYYQINLMKIKKRNKLTQKFSNFTLPKINLFQCNYHRSNLRVGRSNAPLKFYFKKMKA